MYFNYLLYFNYVTAMQNATLKTEQTFLKFKSINKKTPAIRIASVL